MERRHAFFCVGAASSPAGRSACDVLGWHARVRCLSTTGCRLSRRGSQTSAKTGVSTGQEQHSKERSSPQAARLLSSFSFS